MANITELRRKAILLGNEEDSSPKGLILVVRGSDASEERMLRLAEENLRESGIWDALNGYASVLPESKNAAVDFGYLNNGKFEAIAVLRFVPRKISDSEVDSKILRLVSISGSDQSEIRYFTERERDGEVKETWVSLKLEKGEIGTTLFKTKMDAAMANSTVRMKDNRRPVGDKFEGRPGIGN